MSGVGAVKLTGQQIVDYVHNKCSAYFVNDVQGKEIGFAKLAKQDPGRARQNSQARAGTNFTKPRTSLICYFRAL